MGFMDKMKAAAKNADSKAGEEIDKGKLRSKISDEKKAITDLYSTIGKAYYDGLKEGSVPEEGLKNYCNEIDEHTAKIAQYEQEILDVEEKGKAEREKNKADAEQAAKERAEARAAAKAEKEAKKAEENSEEKTEE